LAMMKVNHETRAKVVPYHVYNCLLDF